MNDVIKLTLDEVTELLNTAVVKTREEECEFWTRVRVVARHDRYGLVQFYWKEPANGCRWELAPTVTVGAVRVVEVVTTCTDYAPADDAISVAGEGPAIPMLLWCPKCHDRHVDRGRYATTPHKTHACQNCGLQWKPALVPTVGVEFLPGCGPDEEDDDADEPLTAVRSDL